MNAGDVCCCCGVTIQNGECSCERCGRCGAWEYTRDFDVERGLCTACLDDLDGAFHQHAREGF